MQHAPLDKYFGPSHNTYTLIYLRIDCCLIFVFCRHNKIEEIKNQELKNKSLIRMYLLNGQRKH